MFPCTQWDTMRTICLSGLSSGTPLGPSWSKLFRLRRTSSSAAEAVRQRPELRIVLRHKSRVIKESKTSVARYWQKTVRVSAPSSSGLLRVREHPIASSSMLASGLSRRGTYGSSRRTPRPSTGLRWKLIDAALRGGSAFRNEKEGSLCLDSLGWISSRCVSSICLAESSLNHFVHLASRPLRPIVQTRQRRSELSSHANAALSAWNKTEQGAFGLRTDLSGDQVSWF